jgi:hypothetical protein
MREMNVTGPIPPHINLACPVCIIKFVEAGKIRIRWGGWRAAGVTGGAAALQQESPGQYCAAPEPHPALRATFPKGEGVDIAIPGIPQR